MVATFEVHEGNGAIPGTIGSVGNLNMGNTDAKELVVMTYPVTVGNNAYEKWFVGSWSGTLTRVNNVQFWMSSGSFGVGEVLKWTGSETSYVAPLTSTSTVAIGSVSTSDPGTANVTIGSSLTGSLLAAGRSDWLVLQYQTETTANPGPTNQKEFTIQWDEQ